MTKRNRERLYDALTTAAELISSHTGNGLEFDDVGEEDEKGLMEYTKATERAAKLITTLSEKYRD